MAVVAVAMVLLLRSSETTPEWVVWGDKRNGEDNLDIYALNLASGEERAICTAGGDQFTPAISRD